MKSLLLSIAITIPFLISAGCISRSEVKGMMDEIKKEMDAQKQSQPEVVEHKPIDTSQYVTRDSLDRHIEAHKKNWPHGCDCK